MSRSLHRPPPLPQVIEGTWTLLPEYTTERNAVWKNGLDGRYALAAKGTSTIADVWDDIQLATQGVKAGGAASFDVSLVVETKSIMTKLVELTGTESRITLTGYSLGGWAAVQTGIAHPSATTVVFNGAAPPTNPVLVGSPALNYAYHIGGDIVSSHVGKGPAVVRVDKGYSFGQLDSHMLDRFLVSDPHPITRILTPDIEQLYWLLFGYDLANGTFGAKGGTDPSDTFTAITHIGNPVTNIKQFAAGEFVASTPIPGCVMDGNFGFFSGYLERAEVGGAVVGYYFIVKNGMSGIVMPLLQFANAYAGLAGESGATFASKTVARGQGLFPANEWEFIFAQGNATVKTLETLGLSIPGSGLIAPLITAIAGI